MLLAIVERRQEFALLAAIGWHPGRVVRLVLGEGVALSLIGSLVRAARSACRTGGRSGASVEPTARDRVVCTDAAEPRPCEDLVSPTEEVQVTAEAVEVRGSYRARRSSLHWCSTRCAPG